MGSIQLLEFIESDSRVYDQDFSGIRKLIRDEIEKCSDVTLNSKNNRAELERILFYIELDALGENFQMHQYLKTKVETFVKDQGEGAFENTVCAVIIASPTVDYTKTYLKKIIYAINQMGGMFIGHPAIELLPNLDNFRTWELAIGEKRESILNHQVEKLILRLNAYECLSKTKLNLLALHAGRQDMSTSLKLWYLMKEGMTKELSDVLEIKEIHVEEGKIHDCYGCPYETCLYFAKDKKCFYGGAVVEDLFPALENADVVLWICPNYNDAVSAKLMAVINRMTALYRNMNFYDKYISAIIVSGNSGNDAVAGQLISALSINKGFRLWPKFSFGVLANHPNDLNNPEIIENMIKCYVDTMHKNTYKNIAKS